MLNGINMARRSLKSWAALMTLSFFTAANEAEHVEPVFNEAAGSGEESGGGIIPATFGKGVLPGFRDNYMADNVSNRVLHNMRKQSAGFSKHTLGSVHIK